MTVCAPDLRSGERSRARSAAAVIVELRSVAPPAEALRGAGAAGDATGAAEKVGRERVCGGDWVCRADRLRRPGVPLSALAAAVNAAAVARCAPCCPASPA